MLTPGSGMTRVEHQHVRRQQRQEDAAKRARHCDARSLGGHCRDDELRVVTQAPRRLVLREIGRAHRVTATAFQADAFCP